MKNIFLVIVVFVFQVASVLGGWCVVTAQAQDKMTLTITPPLIKNNVNPGQIWKSYIKVVNNNPEEIDIYIELINFEAGSEVGTVALTPLSKDEIEGNEYLINNWVNIERGPIKVPAYKSKDIPFIVDVPEAADPGDHHVAILVGTEPSVNEEEGSSIKISSKIGSLLLLNVGGEIDESGVVREFSSDKDAYSQGEVNFALRFQNTGNTILQPKGEIRIYNWQEKDLGVITVNHKTNAGNIFPEDTRRWDYSWEVPSSILEMGKYRADMILSYGKQNSEITERTIYFWVIQWKPVLISLSVILFTVLFVVFLVRRSIKRAVVMSQKEIGAIRPQARVATRKTRVIKKAPTRVIKKPVNSNQGVVDLKAQTIKKK